MARPHSRVAQGSVHCRTKPVRSRPVLRETSGLGGAPNEIVMDTCSQAFQVKQGMGISGMVHTRLIIDQYLLGGNEQVPAATCPVHQSDQKMCRQSCPCQPHSTADTAILIYVASSRCFFLVGTSHVATMMRMPIPRLQDRDQRPRLSRPAYLCTDTNEKILSYMKGSTDQGMKRFGYCVNPFAFTFVQGKN